VLQLRQGPLTQADLAEALRLDEHAMGFALKRLAKARVIVPTWLDDQKAWKVTKEPRPVPPAPVHDEEGIVHTDGPNLHIDDDEEPDDDELADVDDEEGLEDDDEEPELEPVRQVLPVAPRPPKKPAAQSTSPWLNKPRDGFSSAMGARAQEMSNTREGLKVKGYPVDTPIPRALR
jgi:hypothetical protein